MNIYTAIEDAYNGDVDAIGALATAATLDPVTGALNRRAIEDFLASRPVKFIATMLDIKGLKSVNETQGYRAGDEYLISAYTLLAGTSGNRLIARVGGDEFISVSVLGTESLRDYPAITSVFYVADDEFNGHPLNGVLQALDSSIRAQKLIAKFSAE